MTAHLGGAITGFVDGELDHDCREQVLGHLAHCISCRHEVDVLRGLKMRVLTQVSAPDHLTARLLAATAPVGHPMLVPRPYAPRPHGHDRWRRTAFGVGALVLGVGGALAAAGPAPSTPLAPVDPTNAGFVQEHVSTSQEIPFVVPVANPVP